MIIEFNGLPGTGKTTVCKALAARLEGNRPYTFGRFPKDGRIKRYISYVTEGCVTFYKLGIKFSDSVCISNGVTDKEIIKKNRGLIFRLIKYYRAYLAFCRKARKDEVMLMDEGLVHGLLTTAHGREITSTEQLDAFLRFLKKKGIALTCVNCLADVSLSEGRIAGRGDTGARLDVCDAEERARILTVQEKNLAIIRQRVAEIMAPATLVIDTAVSVEENSAYIDGELKLSDYTFGE